MARRIAARVAPAENRSASAEPDASGTLGPVPRARTLHRRGFDIAEAQAHLGRRDPRLKRWMARIGPLEVHWHKPFEPVDALARAILYQQLSGKAAATIVGRVEKLLPQGPRLRAGCLAAASPEDLRACGVSSNKQRALQDLAEKSLAGVVPGVAEMRRLHHDEIVERLCAVRGIGRWTVEMLLIFRLGRPDILPVDDLGIRKGAQVVHGLPEMPTPKELLARGERWAPYRTLASLYLWRAVELDQQSRKARRSQG